MIELLIISCMRLRKGQNIQLCNTRRRPVNTKLLSERGRSR